LSAVHDRRIAVLSPHLDDAVLSLGAAIAAATRRGASVRIVTVMAADPNSTAPAGPWDRRTGFRTVGEAARARRDEDSRACAILGADPVWLPYGDEQYDRGATDDEVWAAIVPAIEAADTVLAPGFPLSHEDHAWLTRLVLTRRSNPWRLGLYLEQPYALPFGSPHRVQAIRALLPDHPTWVTIPHRWSERRVKRSAWRQYRSQLKEMAASYGVTWRDLEGHIRSFEARRGGEAVAWVAAPR
jgi:LmbE family N-acetylglucosaminyl deacetylase